MHLTMRNLAGQPKGLCSELHIIHSDLSPEFTGHTHGEVHDPCIPGSRDLLSPSTTPTSSPSSELLKGAKESFVSFFVLLLLRDPQGIKNVKILRQY